MPLDTLLAFSLFAFASSITPGPNNAMMLASGVNFGFRRSLPHLLGIEVGFGMMVLLMGLGIGTLFAKQPQWHELLRYVGGIYMLYLAWKIYQSSPSLSAAKSSGAADKQPSKSPSNAKPMGFLAAAAFQWVNPKAWVMALGAVTTYLPPQHSTLDTLLITALFCTIGTPCCGAWALFGSRMRGYLQDPQRLRLFNTAMALALVLSLYPLINE